MEHQGIPPSPVLLFRSIRAKAISCIALAVLASPIALASPAGAAQVNGCHGVASSAYEDGSPLDSISGPGAGGTSADPFLVSWDGKISWNGDSDTVIKDGKWTVTAESLLPIPLGKAFKNDGGTTNNTDSTTLGEKSPIMVTGKYLVSFKVSGKTGSPCTGKVWIKVIDSPFGTPLFFLALILMIMGFGFIGLPILKALMGR